jgi:3-deoxy-D-manno-octulosonic-acid transferase
MAGSVVKALYNAAMPVAAAGSRVAAAFNPKVRDALDGRRGAVERLRSAGETLGGAVVWFHVSSVGEFEQARPVITALGRHAPHAPVVVTFSSPSGYHYARKRESVDGSSNIRAIDYLPLDTRSNMRACLDALTPRLLVLVKFDLWPNLIWETKKRDVPIVFIDATLSPSSGRLSGAGRLLYRRIYPEIDRILAISDDDADRFRASAPDHPHITVAGDTRFDRVMERHRQAGGPGFHYNRRVGGVVIAGSTWPPDEAHLLPALHALMSRDDSLKLIIAPHEPTPEHLGPLQEWARASRFSMGTVKSGISDPAPRVTIIDTVGVLAEAYTLADVAYIGGAFTTGVHSVIEPAIAGLPALFGPRHDNSFEALRLIERDAGWCVRDEAAIRERLEFLLYDDRARTAAGERARAYVESQLGATEKCLAAMADYL